MEIRDIDYVLTDIVGGGGRWQWFMVFAMWPITFAAGYPILIHMFTAYEPRHRCYIPGCDPEIGQGTDKSLSEALILGSTNPQYDKRLFVDLPVQYMKTTSSEYVVYTNCFLF